MASILKLSAGGVASYTAAGFTLTDFNSIVAPYFVRADTDFDNSTNLDLFGEVSFEFTLGATSPTGGYVSLWFLPLNRTASTYGDETTDGATLPATTYLIGSAGVKSGITSGNKIYGTFPLFALRRGASGRFGISNHVASFNAAAAAQVDIRTQNLNLNG